ncbi:MAG: HD domain-containing protein, partial [Gammaproteobacteria bacterium]|nr:HD domain-containing protein [Gammaproteobacteria bacterium]
MLVLEQACILSDDTQVRFAALVHDLGKGTTPKEEWPRHIAHEARGADIVKKICQRLRIPNEYRDLAERTARFHLHYHRALELKPATVVKTLVQLDAFRKPDRFEKFLLASEADARGRPGYENKNFPQGNYFRQALKAAKAISVDELRSLGFENQQLANKINDARISAVKALKNSL